MLLSIPIPFSREVQVHVEILDVNEILLGFRIYFILLSFQLYVQHFVRLVLGVCQWEYRQR